MASLREQGVGRAWCAAAFGAHGTWGAPRAERKRKVCRQSHDRVACFEKSFGLALEADQGFQQSLATAHPDAVCSLLQTSHLGPHLCTPPSHPVSSLRGLFKGAWGRCVHHPDGPGAPRSSHHAPRTPPGHCGRGRTASRGGEPEVRGGAPGNPSPSEPGGAGAGGRARRCARRERSARSRRARRRTAREAPPPPPGARSSPPPSPLTLPFASGRRPGCVRRGPGRPAHGASANARPLGDRRHLELRPATGTPKGEPGSEGRWRRRRRR